MTRAEADSAFTDFPCEPSSGNRKKFEGSARVGLGYVNSGGNTPTDQIKRMTLAQAGMTWQTTGGTIHYQSFGEKRVTDLVDVVAP